MELAVDYDRPIRGARAGRSTRDSLVLPRWARPVPAPRVGDRQSDRACDAPLARVDTRLVRSAHRRRVQSRWKAETSIFNGREADDGRYNLDLGAFDSVSARLSFLPTERLALQVSVARLRGVSTDFPFPSRNPATRMTSSAMYHKPLGEDGIWATTLALGPNYARETVLDGGVLDETTIADLVESSVTFPIGTRYSAGQKPAECRRTIYARTST